MNSKLFNDIAFAVNNAKENDFVTKNLPYVYKCAMDYIKKHSATTLDEEDLFDEGVIGLIKAAESYDPEKNTNFLGYAKQHIMGYIRNAAVRQGCLVHIPENHYTDKDVDTNVYSESIDADDYDKYGIDESGTFYNDKYEILKRGIAILPKTQQTIARMKFRMDEYEQLESNSMKTIGESLGLKTKEVSDLWKDAQAKLTVYCREEYYDV